MNEIKLEFHTDGIFNKKSRDFLELNANEKKTMNGKLQIKVFSSLRVYMYELDFN